MGKLISNGSVNYFGLITRMLEILHFLQVEGVDELELKTENIRRLAAERESRTDSKQQGSQVTTGTPNSTERTRYR